MHMILTGSPLNGKVSTKPAQEYNPRDMNKRDPKELWEYILTQVELSISPANFNTWFRNSFIHKIEDGVIYVGVPSQFFKDWYVKKFHTLLLKIVRDISYEFRNIEYQIIKDERRKV